MNRYRLVAAMLLASLTLHPPAYPVATQAAALERLLPMPGFAEGWKADGAVAVYDKKTVFDYIDGEAELYFPYGFKGVATVRYVETGKPENALNADVYDMGSLLDAFGIYSNYRDSDSELVKLGGEGIVTDEQLMFYQDKYFVRLAAFCEKAKTRELMMACGQAIAKRLPGGQEQPAELKLLEVGGVAPLTQQYVGQSLLGYAFFPKGMQADVKVGEEKARAFVVIADSADAAGKALDAYVAYLTAKRAEFRKGEAAGVPRVRSQDPLHKGVVVQQVGRYLVGVAKLVDAEKGVPVLEQLTARVPLK